MTQENHEEAMFFSNAQVPETRSSSALADRHQPSAFAVNTHQYVLRLHDKSHRLWSKEDDSKALEAIDLKVPRPSHVGGFSLEKIVFTDKVGVEDGLLKQKPEAGSCRILSICAENSVSPFGITEESIFGILQLNSIPLTFLDILLAFGQKPGNGDAGIARSAFRHRSDLDFDIQYLLTYVELAEGAREKEIRYWTTRQIGLYQHYSRDNDYGFCVLLQTQKQSVVQRSIHRLYTDREAQPGSCFKALLDVHLIVLSSYFQNWQIFLSVLNKNFEDLSKLVLTIQWNDLSDYENGQEQMQCLHYLQDSLFVVSPRLRATLEVIRTLEALEAVDVLTEEESGSEIVHYRRQFLDELKSYKTLTNGLLDSARSIERRVEGILTMLSAALKLRHQATGVEISGEILKLTTDIVNDSAAVRVITYITLLYTPATFIATLLATNSFAYSTSGSDPGLQVSAQFWIFVVLAIPLTLLTVGCWFFYGQRKKILIFKKTEDQKASKLQKTRARWLETLVRKVSYSRKRAVRERADSSAEAENFVGP